MLKMILTKMKPLFEICGIYLLWICIHYFAGILYVHFCTPSTFIGFITSPLLAVTHECTAIRWIIYTGGNVISNMWIICGTWITSHLLKNIRQ